MPLLPSHSFSSSFNLTFVQVSYHTPPRFPEDIIHHIREGASLIFKQLGLHDFARIDGWYLPSSHPMALAHENYRFGETKFGSVIYTDINLV